MFLKPVLLYVDDEKANTLLFKINFRENFELILAESGPEALNILEINPDISIVISDLRMPGMSGLEFVLKAHSRFPSLQYYILSGSDATDEIKTYLESNILTGYFNKPFNVADVTEKLKSQIELKS